MKAYRRMEIQTTLYLILDQTCQTHDTQEIYDVTHPGTGILNFLLSTILLHDTSRNPAKLNTRK
jgi:hypothetical protein